MHNLRDDAYGRAAAKDIVNGLNMALRAVNELDPDPDFEQNSKLYRDLDFIGQRARTFARNRVTAEIWRDATD